MSFLLGVVMKELKLFLNLEVLKDQRWTLNNIVWPAGKQKQCYCAMLWKNKNIINLNIRISFFLWRKNSKRIIISFLSCWQHVSEERKYHALNGDLIQMDPWMRFLCICNLLALWSYYFDNKTRSWLAECCFIFGYGNFNQIDILGEFRNHTCGVCQSVPAIKRTYCSMTIDYLVMFMHIDTFNQLYYQRLLPEQSTSYSHNTTSKQWGCILCILHIKFRMLFEFYES